MSGATTDTSPREAVEALRARMALSIVGQAEVIERLLIGLLANGNLLVEGLPGLAKTRAIKALAKNMECDFSRIQFTPDLLPSDVTGTEVYHQASGAGEFRFEPGPIFANIVLADEINRATGTASSTPCATETRSGWWSPISPSARRSPTAITGARRGSGPLRPGSMRSTRNGWTTSG